MELVKAVFDQDFEKVKVRRPLEAASGTEYGPSRGACMGLGQWTLDAVVARPIRPCCAESTSLRRRRSGNFRVACRRSSGTVTTSRGVMSTLPCHIAESPNFSPPPSPAIAVSATFRRLARLVDARAGSGMASSRLGVLFTVNVYPKRKRGRPSGPACCFVFGYRLGLGYTRGAHPPHPGPAVRSKYGFTALHLAASCGNRRIVGLLVASGADVNSQCYGRCAVSACGELA